VTQFASNCEKNKYKLVEAEKILKNKIIHIYKVKQNINKIATSV